MNEFLNSTVVGNIVGLISLVIGIVSLIWTFITYTTAKKIEKKVYDAQVQAINRLRFKDFRHEALKMLEREREAAGNVKKLSLNTRKRLITIFNKVLEYKSVFNVEDYKRIEELYDRAKILVKTDNQNGGDEAIDFIEITSELEGIIQKGEYDS